MQTKIHDNKTPRHNRMNDQHCVATTLKIIGSKWTVLILHQLCGGTKRFGELQRSLEGISPKTLSVRLQELEKHGIVKKKVYAEVPLKVEYSLTPKGASLKDIITKMVEWGDSFERKQIISSKPTLSA